MGVWVGGGSVRVWRGGGWEGGWEEGGWVRDLGETLEMVTSMLYPEAFMSSYVR